MSCRQEADLQVLIIIVLLQVVEGAVGLLHLCLCSFQGLLATSKVLFLALNNGLLPEKLLTHCPEILLLFKLS